MVCGALQPTAPCSALLHGAVIPLLHIYSCIFNPSTPYRPRRRSPRTCRRSCRRPWAPSGLRSCRSAAGAHARVIRGFHTHPRRTGSPHAGLTRNRSSALSARDEPLEGARVLSTSPAPASSAKAEAAAACLPSCGLARPASPLLAVTRHPGAGDGHRPGGQG